MSFFSRFGGKNDDELVRQVQERYVFVLEQTGAWVKEADRLRDAGVLDDARAGYEKCFQLVVKLEEDQGGVVPPEFVQLGAMALERMGDVDSMKSDFGSALQLFEKSYEFYIASVGPAESAVQVLAKMADVYERGNVLDQARELYEAAVEMAGQIDFPPQQRATLLNNVSRVYAQQGDIERGLKFLEEAVAIDRREGADPDEAAVHLNNLGEAYYLTGDLERAQKCMEEAAALGTT